MGHSNRNCVFWYMWNVLNYHCFNPKIFFFIIPKSYFYLFHLLWQLRFSSRTIIRLWPRPGVGTGLGLLTARLITSGEQKPLFTTSNQPSGKQSKSRGITRSRSQSETSLVVSSPNSFDKCDILSWWIYSKTLDHCYFHENKLHVLFVCF